MGILEQLQGLIKIVDLSQLRKSIIKVVSDNHLSLFTVYKNQYTINLSPDLKPEELEMAKKLLKGLVIEDGRVLLDESSNQKIQDFKQLESGKPTQVKIEFFRSILSPSDLTILRASLYLAEVHARGDRDLAHKLKKEISDIHGLRGRNIANLCTAGYFETIIKPLYEEMAKRSDFTIDAFRKAYDTIVMSYPFAVFISNESGYSHSRKEVIDKMEYDKRYGIHKLNIHGIGEQNVKKILKIVADLTSFYTDQPKIESSNNQIMVTIFF